MEEDVSGAKRQELCQALFDHIPVGVGQDGVIPLNTKDLEDVLLMGMDWSLKREYFVTGYRICFGLFCYYLRNVPLYYLTNCQLFRGLLLARG